MKGFLAEGTACAKAKERKEWFVCVWSCIVSNYFRKLKSVFQLLLEKSENLFALSQNPCKATYWLEQDKACPFGQSTCIPGHPRPHCSLSSHIWLL